MKKPNAIQIFILLFVAISLWACDGNTKNKEEEAKDSTEAAKPTLEIIDTVPDTRPAFAMSDEESYIKLQMGDKEFNFTYLDGTKSEGQNLIKSNLFRIERCADDRCKKVFYLQLHNFDVTQTPPFTLQNGNPSGIKQVVKANFMNTNNKGRVVHYWVENANKGIEVTIQKVEGEVYEGDFKGQLKLRGVNMDSVVDVTGSFKAKMKVRGELKPAA